jgi:hypothetical protein
MQSRAKLDDVEFVLDGITPQQPEDVCTSSTVSLAALCKDNEIRVLLRAHSLMTKVLNALHHASKQVNSRLKNRFFFARAALQHSQPHKQVKHKQVKLVVLYITVSDTMPDTNHHRKLVWHWQDLLLFTSCAPTRLMPN